MLRYDFKPAEFGWMIAVGVITAAGQILYQFDPEQITDWRLWAVASTGAMVRAVGGAVLAYFGREVVSSD